MIRRKGVLKKDIEKQQVESMNLKHMGESLLRLDLNS